jgi:3-oxoadipate enol-lactonase
MITSKSGFAELNDAVFYYEIAGTGHPLVLLHAGICDSRMWDEQVAALAQHYQVVRYDLRGYGQTAMVDGPFAHRADLYALLNYLEIERTHLVGCSMGGSACLDFVVDYPAMVERLILVGSALSGFQANHPWPAQIVDVDAALTQGDFERASELEVQIWVDGPSRTPDQVAPAIRDRVRAMNAIALQNEVLELGQPQPLVPPAAQRLGEVQAPTLLLVGDLDQPRVLEATEFMATHLPKAHKHVLTGTAHLSNLEQPAQFNELVLTFLASR